MDVATDTKVEVKGTMNVSDEHWNAIFSKKPKKETEETREEDNDSL